MHIAAWICREAITVERANIWPAPALQVSVNYVVAHLVATSTYFTYLAISFNAYPDHKDPRSWEKRWAHGQHAASSLVSSHSLYTPSWLCVCPALAAGVVL
jgi:hypothetical protein